ncbi:MAG TPA: hypothetical protein VMJ32_14785 [Pirellulales bacterium]|nr:hypothetical protein [Pirellulales bacterium]
MKPWQLIRHERMDLTDFLIHLTRDGGEPYLDAKDRLKKILRQGFIRPSFAPLANRFSAGKTRPTIKGPRPAVCLTDQPIWALVKMEQLRLWNKRYSGYGLAYYKPYLHCHGARPVIYGDENILGSLAPAGHREYRKDREIYINGIPSHLQYLWARYLPAWPNDDNPPIDFTWEREWRFPVHDADTIENAGLEFPIGLGARLCAVIVRYDDDIREFRKILKTRALKSKRIQAMQNRIVSLETAEQQIEAGNMEYGRLDTWPDFKGQFDPPPKRTAHLRSK